MSSGFKITKSKAARTALVVALALPAAGCLLTDDKLDPALDIPAAYKEGPKSEKVAEAALPKLDWWRGFKSRELTEIVEQARESNLDVAAAVARIVQADAQSRIAGAALLPIVDANGDVTKSQSSRNTGSSSGGGGGSPRKVYTASLTASYEIDFWGKNRAALQSAEQSAVAARYDREVVALSTEATVANAYFQVLSSQDRLRVARDNLTSATRVLNLIKQRLDAGTASELDTSQQESVVNSLRANIPPLEQNLQQNKNALALLMGIPPERVTIRGGSLRAIAIPRVTPGLPSELITQRPDIKFAEAQLAAADADVANARAQLLPSITLTGTGGYQSAALKMLFEPQSTFYSLAAGVTQPIFEGGRLMGNVDLQKGRQDELMQNYRKSVVSGFTDVDNALIAIRQTAEAERLLAAVVNSSRRAFQISEQRLNEGTVDLVTVLNTQQTLYQAQDALAQARLNRLSAVVQLYQALGGGWLPKPVEEANAR
ncbi:MAG TPA: efflux transporter outer membrane subunit [Pseudolabrys sp.]|nr:efflux transporter outer membrane subunit [Pseudolabrys sp.]